MNSYYSLNSNMENNIKKFTIDVNNLAELFVKKRHVETTNVILNVRN